MESYFYGFESSKPNEDELTAVVSKITRKLTPEISTNLDRPFTAIELKATIFAIGSTKAPGPDGFHNVFFQKM